LLWRFASHGGLRRPRQLLREDLNRSMVIFARSKMVFSPHVKLRMVR
jgi:hypothetical protein